MTEKELRKLNRFQLLELLIIQTERADNLQRELDAVNQQLAEKQIRIQNLGSIAEAALQLNGVFEAAQQAADQYLQEAKRQAESILQQAREKTQEQTIDTQEDSQNEARQETN